MLNKSNIFAYLIIQSVLALVMIFNSSCSESPTMIYKTFEMKADDVRLTWCNHPLISFEYPEMFNFIDHTQPDGTRVTGGISDIMSFVRQEGIPEQSLWIRIEEPRLGYHDSSSDILKEWISSENKSGHSLKTQKVIVSGVTTDYLECFYRTLDYPEYQRSFRGITFDYNGLIYSIQLFWSYLDSEPPEIQEYFNHIIETFNIPDTNCSNAPSGNELNVKVSYMDGVFTITNNEDFTLCMVQLFLNYTGDNLSTGYRHWEMYGIQSHQTIKLKSGDFVDHNGWGFRFIPKNLLIQAEFPGCNQKVYTYLKTWA